MYDRKKQTEYLLKKIETTLERIIGNSSEINSYQYYASSPSGMERLESTCMLLIALGESIKGVDKLTDKQLLQNYPQVDWKGAMGIHITILILMRRLSMMSLKTICLRCLMS